MGAATPDSYSPVIANVTADGFAWDGTPTSATLTINGEVSYCFRSSILCVLKLRLATSILFECHDVVDVKLDTKKAV